jgi:hypothetical protein
VGLTIQLRGDAVRPETTGPVTPTIEATAYYDVVPDDRYPMMLNIHAPGGFDRRIGLTD